METITRTEWTATHRDHKGIINGVAYIMRFEAGSGTVLAPVQVEGLKLRDRISAIRYAAESGKATNADNVRVHPATATLILRSLELFPDQAANRVDGLAKLNSVDFENFVKSVNQIARSKGLL